MNPEDPKDPTGQFYERQGMQGQTHLQIPKRMRIETIQRIHVDQSAWDQSGLAEMDASFVVQRWRHLPEHVAGQPNRKGHDGHVLNLHNFLQTVGKQPSGLCDTVEKKRGNDDEPLVSIRV